MRALIPVACVAGFALMVRFAWDEVHEAITKSTSNSPYLHAPPPATHRPPAAVEEEPAADDRVFEPGAALPPPARPRGRTQYADPFAARPPRTHPAERVTAAPPADAP